MDSILRRNFSEAGEVDLFCDCSSVGELLLRRGLDRERRRLDPVDAFLVSASCCTASSNSATRCTFRVLSSAFSGSGGGGGSSDLPRRINRFDFFDLVRTIPVGEGS